MTVNIKFGAKDRVLTASFRGKDIKYVHVIGMAFLNACDANWGFT